MAIQVKIKKDSVSGKILSFSVMDIPVIDKDKCNISSTGQSKTMLRTGWATIDKASGLGIQIQANYQLTDAEKLIAKPEKKLNPSIEVSE